jgi:hypothetical protein
MESNIIVRMKPSKVVSLGAIVAVENIRDASLLTRSIMKHFCVSASHGFEYLKIGGRSTNPSVLHPKLHRSTKSVAAETEHL